MTRLRRLAHTVAVPTVSALVVAAVAALPTPNSDDDGTPALIAVIAPTPSPPTPANPDAAPFIAVQPSSIHTDIEDGGGSRGWYRLRPGVGPRA